MTLGGHVQLEDLQRYDVAGGGHISSALDGLSRTPSAPWPDDFRNTITKGIAFLTFAFDIDGVSMEIAKYGRCFEDILPGVSIHCVGGNFGPKADAVLDPTWRRFVLDGADGWDKWDGGTWFTRLFFEDLPPDSATSSELAAEMWGQAVGLTDRLVAYIERHEIGLLFAVNTNSNPGNLAFGLAVALAAETTGAVVINNNHDFFWEGGKAGCKRNPGEEPGPRDHFFRNHDNEEFFSVFQRIYPWNGRRWVQVNINSLQSRRLIDRFHFRPDRVFTIGTGIDPTFFRKREPDRKRELRASMARVLGGDPLITPMPVERFRRDLASWMPDQRPVVCSVDGAQQLDLAAPDALILLQPTRVVARKRIWRDWELITALLRHGPFRSAFEERPEVTLTLQITGPVPIEHRSCLERVLDSYQAALEDLPVGIRERLFVAFSVGWQSHPSLTEDVGMVDIYQFADLVTFPSLTEGRGLPIAEASAAGVPIVCSRYEPHAVFSEVVGLHLGAEEQIQFEEFPEGEFSDELIDRLTAILLDPASQDDRIEHNRDVARRRYSLDVLRESLAEVLDRLERTVRGN